MFYLAGDPPDPGAPWQKWRLRPGSLFVVGDPKQSIYRFRRADIGTYNLVKDLILKSGGDIITLSTNFRSVNSIGTFVDDTFVNVFPSEADEFQAAFVPLRTRRDDSEEYSGVFCNLLPSFDKRLDIIKVDSEYVASWIAWALKGNVRVEDGGELRDAEPRDFLVLTLWRAIVSDAAGEFEGTCCPAD